MKQIKRTHKFKFQNSFCKLMCHLSAFRSPQPNFIHSWKKQSNSIKFYWISNSRTNLDFLIQIIFRHWKSSNKESCSLFQMLQIHILFEIFWSPRRISFDQINSSLLQKFQINGEGHYFSVGLACFPCSRPAQRAMLLLPMAVAPP
jgi:hypothetical protein